MNMFSNKKNNLPPRPRIPNSEHMLEDLNNSSIDDIAFKIIHKDEISGENLMNASTSDTYQKVKMYLHIKQQLKYLETTLESKEQQLKTDNEEIKRLADNIKKQAQAALIT
ncbi:hypothetical protein HZU73_01033 [Apis mellifera caucasica]|uniref:Uncharacterized protein LOC107965045 n=1 Tax=Apis mellifera TaxID=7460 RepID=A0A7M7MPB0_APIME|nr:uncharacterized protein LOC107965045 [Apis mellifera]KAG6803655.1 hypothetical protein HZU73_01033 [Apis mellifera caucasica]KAG9430677.1 hypothetical protein HZU67_07880 [Apis mellifera carnica]|eukprot:XP_026298963.1 uncharacterized protein LOC107965045 [Apis mellifera]